jgi:hypothetical protein
VALPLVPDGGLFAGPRAEAAKAHAFRLANAFRMRLAAQAQAEAEGGFNVTRHGPRAG